jgi:hypothetical protein
VQPTKALLKYPSFQVSSIKDTCFVFKHLCCKWNLSTWILQPLHSRQKIGLNLIRVCSIWISVLNV